MKKALALLVLSLATLPSLADQTVRVPYYRIGASPTLRYSNPAISTLVSPQNTTAYSSAESLTKTNQILFTTYPVAGQELVHWVKYRDNPAAASSVGVTNNVSEGISTFVWNYSNEGTVQIVLDFDYITYTLNYNGNGGSGSMTNETACYTNVFNLASNRFAKTGYSFGGWTNETITAALADQSSVSGAVFGVTYTNKTATLYAKWTPNTYNVTLNPGFEATATNVVQVTYDAAWPSLAVPNREGYRFLGWFTSENGGSEINTNSTYTTANSSTNYAHWIRRVTATFNDGRTDELVSKQEIDAGQKPVTPQAPDHSADGYYFKGWVPAVAAIDNDTVYTAEYSPYTYTVVFHADNGTSATQTQEFTYNDSQAALNTVVALGFSLEGYSFQNWTNSTGIAYGDGQQVSNLAKSGEYHLYAVWSPIQYTIAFDANGGSGTMAPMENIKYDTVTNLTKCGFTKQGVDFKCWTCAGRTFDDEAQVSNLTNLEGVVTMKAVWSEKCYVEYDANGGTGEMATQTFDAEDLPASLTSNAFEKVGYTFSGWATNETDAAALTVTYVDGKEFTTFASLPAVAGETATLYAVWQTNAYTVVFDPNCTSYTGTMADQSFVYDQAQALTVNGFTNEADLTFAGWTNKVSGATYTNGEVVVNLTPTNGATVTLFAVWDVGELSKAMHCSTLYWTNPNPDIILWNDGWDCKYEADAGFNADSCVASERKTSLMMVTVKTNGTLRFHWKSNTTRGPKVIKDVQNIFTFVEISDLTSGEIGKWHDSGEIAIGLGENENELEIGLFFDGYKSSDVCYIDQLTWTPEGSTVEPTEKDKPTIGVFAATADGFTLSASNVSESFNYQILATNELVGGDWPVMTNLTSDVIGSGFTIVPEADEPTMFYKVKVIAK